MTYANILVSVDFAEGAPDRVRLAAGLAHRFDAMLTGVAAADAPVPLFAHDVRDAQAQYERAKDEIRHELERAQGLFARSAGGAPRTAWRGGVDSPLAYLVEQARAADLLVLGRTAPTDLDPGPLGVLPGPVLMEAARPVVVVPPDVIDLRACRIVVAWKDTSEARRAVSGALPFIRSAEQVFVASVGDNARLEGAQDVAAHLARHGARTTAHLLSAAESDGAEILRFARQQEADLIVMGAYGHSRLREWAFGGATRDVLDATPICCLMAH